MAEQTRSLAGAFRCYSPPGFDEKARRILYVGKATHGQFQDDDDDPSSKGFNHGPTAFWRFARSLSRIADPQCEDVSNLAWSNIFKQGLAAGNPSGEVAERQRASATEALRKEVSLVNPHVIVLVTAGYYEEIVKAAYEIDDGEIGERALKCRSVAGSKFDLWFRPAYSHFPPILWIYHPQGKSKSYIEAGLALCSEITGW